MKNLYPGDYRTANSIDFHTIPDAQLALDAMKQFKIFAETDWTRSFHQIPISEFTSKLLTIVTPYGQYRPLFLPEGVQPASGILADVVRQIFSPFSAFIIS